MIYVIGVDPGLDGGVALYAQAGSCRNVEVFPMPTRPVLVGVRKKKSGKRELDIPRLKDLLDNFELPLSCCQMVAVEQVSSRPGQGSVSTFTFGTGFGQILGFFQGQNHEPTKVMPRVWKNRILLSNSHDKQAAIDYCEKHFPEVSLIPGRCRVPHDGIADALCIAEYAIIQVRSSQDKNKAI